MEDGFVTTSLKTFCIQLLNHSQWKSTRTFTSGSSMEISNRHTITHLLGLNLEKLDIDKMMFSEYRYAVSQSAVVPDSYFGEIIRIYSNNMHAGYVCLIREKNNTELMRRDFGVLINIPEHGPALLSNSRNDVLCNEYTLKNENADERQFNKITVTNQDLVCAIHSPFWPVEATEWITRMRRQGFPSNLVIKRVVGYGCDFVQVSHEFSDSKDEWRFSFSRAELFIADSWTVQQKIVYGTLWVINKKIDSAYLCTYYFKTLMFWACEEKSADFWRDDALANSVRELLTEMIDCLKSKFCRNYFIRDNNMFDRFADTDFSREIDVLRELSSQETQFIPQVLTAFQLCEMTSFKHSDHYELPSWLKRSLLIYTRVNHYFDNYTDLFKTNMTSDFWAAIYIEFVDTFKGLQLHREAANCADASRKDMYLFQGENHLTNVTRMSESKERDRIDNCCDAFNQLIMEYFKNYDTDEPCAANKDKIFVPDTVVDAGISSSGTCNDTFEQSTAFQDDVNAINVQNTHNCLPRNTSVVKLEKEMALTTSTNMRGLVNGRQVNIELHNETHVSDSHIDTDIVRYKEWPGWSPTVNISWFIAKAYLANLYYTTQRDVRLVIQICDDINDVYIQSRMNRWFAELSLPFVVSTQWTGIYDKEIQDLLGLYSLCSYVFDKSCSPSVYLGVCPVHFAIYLKVRIERAHVLGDWDTFDKFIEHQEVCAGDHRVHNGVQLLLCAVEIAEARAI